MTRTSTYRDGSRTPQWVEELRSGIRELQYLPEPEAPTRLAKQLAQLGAERAAAHTARPSARSAEKRVPKRDWLAPRPWLLP